VKLQSSNDNTYSVESTMMKTAPLPFSIDDEGEIYFLHAPANAGEKLEFFTAAFAHGIRELKKNHVAVPPVHILLDTSDFFLEDTAQKLGFGSSAALTVALLAAVLASTGQSFLTQKDRQNLYEMGTQIHRRVQGKIGSGIDVAAGTFGGILRYQIPGESPGLPAIIEEAPISSHLYMLVTWTGKPASTRQLVRSVQKFKENEPSGYQRIIDEMTDLSFAGSSAFINNNISYFIEIVREYCKAMQKLGEQSDAPIVSREHRQLAEITAKNGAVYKPSGAGGGDIGVFFAGSPGVINNTKSAVETLGYHVVQTQIARKGVQII